VAGALLGAWVYCRRAREPLAPILDALAWPILLLGLLSWSGCLATSCAYGYEVTPGQLPQWLTLTAPDIYGLTVLRFPTQVLGLGWSLAAFAVAWTMRARRWPAGARGAYALSLVALGAFALAFTRADPMPLTLGFYRLDLVGSALVLVTSTLAWGLRTSNAKLQTPNPASPPLPPSPVPTEPERGEGPGVGGEAT
jgi:hypothetical protein